MTCKLVPTKPKWEHVQLFCNQTINAKWISFIYYNRSHLGVGGRGNFSTAAAVLRAALSGHSRRRQPSFSSPTNNWELYKNTHVTSNQLANTTKELAWNCQARTCQQPLPITSKSSLCPIFSCLWQAWWSNHSSLNCALYYFASLAYSCGSRGICPWQSCRSGTKAGLSIEMKLHHDEQSTTWFSVIFLSGLEEMAIVMSAM